MPTSPEAFSAQAIKLPPEECMGVVERILDSLDALCTKEAEDRLAAYQRGDMKAIALSEVIAKLQRHQPEIATLFVADCT